MTRHRFALLAALLAAGTATAAACVPLPENAPPSTEEAAPQVIVMGAASTRVLNSDLTDIADADLLFVNAGSSTLVQQLADGAPGDVLLTADQATMDQAVAQGLVTDPQVVATNSMVMVVPAGNPADVGSSDDLADADVVLCDPQVPCGTVSEALIDEQDIDVTPVSLEHSVSDVLGKVVSGEADAGWVYRTDAQAAGNRVEVIDLPGAEAHPNSIVAAVTGSSTDPAAASAFVSLLRSPEAADVWRDHGFTPAES